MIRAMTLISVLLSPGCNHASPKWILESFNEGIITLEVGGVTITAICENHFVFGTHVIYANRAACEIPAGLTAGSDLSTVIEKHGNYLSFRQGKILEGFQIVPSGHPVYFPFTLREYAGEEG